MASPAPLVQIQPSPSPATDPSRKPSWLKVKAPGGPNYVALKHMMRDLKLHTVFQNFTSTNLKDTILPTKWMTRQRAQESLSDTIYENCPYCGGRGVVKTSMTTSVELHRSLNTVMRKYQDSVHDFRVILNPDVLKRLKEEDEELLIELERRYAGRLMFRGDPTYHHEKFVVTDATTGAELKS